MWTVCDHVLGGPSLGNTLLLFVCPCVTFDMGGLVSSRRSGRRNEGIENRHIVGGIVVEFRGH